MLLVCTRSSSRPAGQFVASRAIGQVRVRFALLFDRIRTAALDSRARPGGGRAGGGAEPCGGRLAAGQPVGRTAGETLARLRRAVTQERRGPGRGSIATTFGRRQPRRRRGPITRRVASGARVIRVGGIWIEIRFGPSCGRGRRRSRSRLAWSVVIAWIPRAGERRGRGGGCTHGPGAGAGTSAPGRAFARCGRAATSRGGRRVGGVPGPCSLASRPVLEGRADRKRAREAVRLLVGERARRRTRLRVAAVPAVGNGRPLVPIVLERHERAGRRAVREGQAAFSHQSMIPARSVRSRAPRTAAATAGRVWRRG